MTLLFLHAFPLDARMWDPVLGLLETEDYAVPDLPGPTAENSLAAWAARLLRELEGDLVPVGCSMGGYLVFELWRQAPGRIRALVLADTRAGADAPAARDARDETIRLLRAGRFDAFWESLVPKLFASDTDPQLVEEARRMAAEQPRDGLVAAVQALRDRSDSGPTLGTIDVPTLVVVGAEDTLTPPDEARRIAQGVTGAELETIERAGHLSPLERPQQFATALRRFVLAKASSH